MKNAQRVRFSARSSFSLKLDLSCVCYDSIECLKNVSGNLVFEGSRCLLCLAFELELCAEENDHSSSAGKKFENTKNRKRQSSTKENEWKQYVGWFQPSLHSCSTERISGSSTMRM